MALFYPSDEGNLSGTAQFIMNVAQAGGRINQTLKSSAEGLGGGTVAEPAIHDRLNKCKEKKRD